jgi:Na+:H+ antiporter, NhaA family
VLLGLLVGKPLGVFSACWIAVKLKIAQLPKTVRWNHVAGIGALAGIGFTVSLFIGALAFDDLAMLDAAKTAILLGSLLAGISGYLLLSRLTKPVVEPGDQRDSTNSPTSA